MKSAKDNNTTPNPANSRPTGRVRAPSVKRSPKPTNQKSNDNKGNDKNCVMVRYEVVRGKSKKTTPPKPVPSAMMMRARNRRIHRLTDPGHVTFERNQSQIRQESCC